jgi:ATP adenylyltransferase
MFPDTDGAENKEWPFHYFINRTMPQRDDSKAPEKLKLMYDELLAQAVRQLGLPDEGLPHNLIFVKQWMLLIPRSRAKVDGAGTGSGGVVGMIWVNDEDELNAWKRQGFLEVLKKLCFARSQRTK